MSPGRRRTSVSHLAVLLVLFTAAGCPAPSGQSPGPSAAGCSVTVSPVDGGPTVQLVGSGFPPNEPATIVIEDATGVLELTQTTNPELRTDVRGRVLFLLHPRREHIGTATIRLGAGGCRAQTTQEVLESWFPPACPDGDPGAAGADAATAYEELVLADDPIAYWRFEDEVGPIAAATRGTDAAYVGDVILGRAGPIAGSRAVGLPGSFPRVDLVDIELGGDFTIEGWMLFCDDAIDNNDALFGPIPNLNFFEATARLWDGETDRLIADRPVEHARWYHVGLVREGADLVLYLDGSVAGRGRLDGPLPIGALGDADIGTLTGQLDEIAIYEVALPAERLLARIAAAR